MKKIVFKIIAALFMTACFAQNSFFDNYMYHSWNAFAGLSGTTATDIYQTKDGYITVGTYEGLVRFDGIEFKLLKKAKDTPYSFISVRTILEDKNGDLWIGSNDEGLHYLHDGIDEQITINDGLPNNSIRALTEDTSHNIWIGTAEGIVYRTPDGKIETPSFAEGIASKSLLITSIFCDTAGRIWITTQNEHGLYVSRYGFFSEVDELKDFASYTASSVAQDQDGAFWISLDSQGLIRMSDTGITRIKTGTILDYVAINSIQQDQQGNVWFGTNKGLVVFSSGKYYEYPRDDLKNAVINKLICDRENNIWVATDRDGIGKLTKSKFKMIKTDCPVNSIEQDKYGRVWAGTDRGLKCYSYDKEIHNALTDFVTKDMRIRNVAATKSGAILVSVYSEPGQIIFKNGVIKTYSRKDGLAGNKVRVAIEAPNGDIYVGTTTGLSVIHTDGSISSFLKKDGLNTEYVMALYYDINGYLWIGTDGGGIYIMKDEKIISHITEDDGLSGNVIFKISQDPNNVYWICTGKGITVSKSFNTETYKPEDLVYLNSDTGLGTDSVFQALCDHTNFLWIISNHGICSTPISEAVEVLKKTRDTLNAKYYNLNDGLDSKGATATAKSIVDKYGRLWFTMVDSIAIFDPVKITQNPVKPLVHIEKLTVDNIEYTNPSGTIVLKPGTKRIEIKFAGLSFDAPERIQYSYRLSGFDDSFSKPNFQRTVSYTNLRPGSHTFYINAINGDGFYSEDTKSITLEQKPYYYQTITFWLIILFLILSATFSFFYFKNHAIRAENILLEKKVYERTQELKAANDKSEKLLRAILPNKIAEELKDGIRSIGESFDDVTLLFSDIVNFTKTSSSHSANEIVESLNNLFSKFDERAKNMGVEKIKTIGDAYMAACGIPIKNKDHAKIMIDFARGIYQDLEEYNKTAKIKFTLRVGLNCGSVTAGVIGKTKFIYDVWGDTVNVASRMESVCTPQSIRVSDSVRNHLKDTDIKFSDPIECDIKGKGRMITYEVLL